jgi:hypothetical protein
MRVDARSYRSVLTNAVHAPAATLSVQPPRSVLSRTRTTLLPLAASTQDPPLAWLWVLLRQLALLTSTQCPPLAPL